jgi:hypothetical protein
MLASHIYAKPKVEMIALELGEHISRTGAIPTENFLRSFANNLVSGGIIRDDKFIDIEYYQFGSEVFSVKVYYYEMYGGFLWLSTNAGYNGLTPTVPATDVIVRYDGE